MLDARQLGSRAIPNRGEPSLGLTMLVSCLEMSESLESTPEPEDGGFESLLARIEEGDPAAAESLYLKVHSSIYRRARQLMRGQPAGHSLQATALVNEVYLRLARRRSWADRQHLLLTAARAMRQILVDHSRRKSSKKRDGVRASEPLDEIVIEYEERSEDLGALNEALTRLSEFDPVMTQVIELRFFAGRSMDEIAKLVGIPERTLSRRWKVTRAWLHRQVS